MYSKKIYDEYIHTKWKKTLESVNRKFIINNDVSDNILAYIASDALLKYKEGNVKNVESWYLNLDEVILNEKSLGYWRTKKGIGYLKYILFKENVFEAQQNNYAIININGNYYINSWCNNYIYKNEQLRFNHFNLMSRGVIELNLYKDNYLISYYLDYLLSISDMDNEDLMLIEDITIRDNFKKFYQLYKQLNVSGIQILENLKV